jgi:glycosyltransferase involved in cell wall biosynthesis
MVSYEDRRKDNVRSLSIIIPVRAGDDPAITLHSLGRSEFQDFTITIQHDEWGNANKARNAGFRLAPDSEFVLFSDADIEWEPKGIGAMVEALPFLSESMGWAASCTAAADTISPRSNGGTSQAL